MVRALFILFLLPQLTLSSEPVHWAFAPLAQPDPKTLERHHNNPIDQFVVSRLKKAGLSLSPQADRRTLLRRLSFDLIGLPPTPGQMNAFLQDESPRAFGNQVDHLLNSPHHGERQARRWLDVIRYAESTGFEHNSPWPEIWRFRDWVIHSFNQDLPYDQFVKHQIAGDVLHPKDPLAVVATGFLACGPYDKIGNELGTVTMQKFTRQTELGELVGTVSQTFLGLTVECARCHDHKYDPISQKEYFQIAAALGGVKGGSRKPVEGDPSRTTQERIETLTRKIDTLTRRQKTLLASITGQPEEEKPPQTEDYATLVLEDAPLGYWRFEEPDSEDTAHNQGTLGEIINGHYSASVSRAHPSLTTDKSNHSVTFASDSVIKVPPFEKFESGTGFTVEFLLQLTTEETSGFMNIVGDGESGEDFNLMVYLGGGNFLRAHLQTEHGIRAIDSIEKLKADVIYHVASRWDKATGELTLFINGAPAPHNTSIGEVPDTGKPVHTDNGLFFGANGRGSSAPPIHLDEVAIYNKPLTMQRISQHANAAGVTRAQIPTWDQRLEDLDEEALGRLNELFALERERSQLKLHRELAQSRSIRAVTPRQPEPFHVLARGDFRNPGERVSPSGLAALPNAQDFGLSHDAPEAKRRRKLAEWITHPGNPIAARVLVNRIWQQHFGQGLVATPNDFGINGAKPSHPELLDFLANHLIQNGWRQKVIHRLIVTSDTYRQQSLPRPVGDQADPDNRLLWRYNPQRLDAESLRDTLLHIAGRLNPRMGGRSDRDVRVKRQGEAHAYLPRAVTNRFERRSIYRMWARSGTTPFLAAFDCPNTSVRTPRRDVTTTPLQALALMNSTLVDRQAEALANRAARFSPQHLSGRIVRVYDLAFQRMPTETEEAEAEQFIGKHGLKQFCLVLFNSNEFLYVD